MLSVEKNKATIETIQRANKVVRKLKRQESSIFSRNIGEVSTFELHIYSDASLANLPDGASSAGGYIIFLTSNQDNGLCCLMEWKSVKLQRVVGSTLEAECIPLRVAIGAAIYMGHLFSDFYSNDFITNHIPVISFTEHLSLEASVWSTKQVKEKRLRINLTEIERML